MGHMLLCRLNELSRKRTSSPEKLPSGITADYRDQDKSIRPTSLSASIPPPLPERPPPKLQKKSILKSKTSYDVSRSVSSDLDDMQVLLKNTKENSEYINVYKQRVKAAAAAAAAGNSSPNKSSPTSTGSLRHVANVQLTQVVNKQLIFS